MQGRRIFVKDSGDGTFYLDKECTQAIDSCQPGDYWNGPLGWAGKLPNGMRCGLAKHQITEHGDGTITVSPSILVHGEWPWHGFLERGVWREC